MDYFKLNEWLKIRSCAELFGAHRNLIHYTSALRYLSGAGHLNPDRVLDGFPHPSGANAERISYILGAKEASQLSSKTNPHVLDRARAEILRKVSALG